MDEWINNIASGVIAATLVLLWQNIRRKIYRFRDKMHEYKISIGQIKSDIHQILEIAKKLDK